MHWFTWARNRGSPYWFLIRLRLGTVPSPWMSADCDGFCERSQAAHDSRSIRSSFRSSISRIMSKSRMDEARHSPCTALRSEQIIGCLRPSRSAMADCV